MRYFGYLLILAFFSLSLLNVTSTQNLVLWKLSILANEYGHGLALIGFLLIAAIVRSRPSIGWPTGLSLMFILMACVLFLRPAYFAWKVAPEIKQELLLTFGDSDVLKRNALSLPHLFSPPSLNFGRPHPETHEYVRYGDEALKLDYYRPKPGAIPAAWILVIHGGGWNGGDRSQLSELNSYLAEKGYGVISMSYRLVPKWKWPAPKEDVLAAVKYVKENHVKFGLDPASWFILGRSAGGQIAEAVAYSLPDPTLRGCIAFYAPADLNFAYQFGAEDDILGSLQLLRDYLGGTPTQVPDAYHEASSFDFVNPKSPPTLLFHGELDTLVWHRQSERLIKKLKENSVKSMFLSFTTATHGFDFNLIGPSGQASTYAVEHFLETQRKRPSE